MGAAAVIMKNDITVFDVTQLITEHMPEIERCMAVVSKFGHEHGGVIAVQVLDCSPGDEVVPPPGFLQTLNLDIVEQITEVTVCGSGVQCCPPSWWWCRVKLPKISWYLSCCCAGAFGWNGCGCSGLGNRAFIASERGSSNTFWLATPEKTMALYNVLDFIDAPRGQNSKCSYPLCSFLSSI